MKNAFFVLALASLLTVSIALAEHHEQSEKPSLSTTQTIKLTALVEAVDLEKREVTLVGPQGNKRTLHFGEDATRLNEVEVGDTVLAEYVQNLSIEVMANEGTKAGSGGVMAAVGRAPEDEAPGVVMADSTVKTAIVNDINLENNTFKLDWGEGNIEEYVAQDPANLKKADVGDLVVVTYTEALALTLQEIPAE